MKDLTHPQTTLTTIYFKDGSINIKRWMFHNPTLLVEADITSNPVWKRLETIDVLSEKPKKFLKV